MSKKRKHDDIVISHTYLDTALLEFIYNYFTRYKPTRQEFFSTFQPNNNVLELYQGKVLVEYDLKSHIEYLDIDLDFNSYDKCTDTIFKEDFKRLKVRTRGHFLCSVQFYKFLKSINALYDWGGENVWPFDKWMTVITDTREIVRKVYHEKTDDFQFSGYDKVFPDFAKALEICKYLPDDIVFNIVFPYYYKQCTTVSYNYNGYIPYIGTHLFPDLFM